MNAMSYYIRFEESLDLGDIECYLVRIDSPIRLEIGDKIAISYFSFDRSEESWDDIDRMMELLLEKSIYPSNYKASFEISYIMYNHEFFGDDGINFHGVVTLKGK